MTETEVPAAQTRPDGVVILAIYHFFIAFMFFIGACSIVGFALTSVLTYCTDEFGCFAAVLGISIGLIFVVFFAVIALITGFGLLAMKGWSRLLAIIQGILSLIWFPVGTLAGALTIWYLLQDTIKAAFDEAA